MKGILYQLHLLLLCCTFQFCHSLEYCGPPDIDDSVIKKGVINLIYITEASCKLCNKQIKLLPRLVDELNRKAIPVNVVVTSNDPLNKFNSLILKNAGKLKERLGTSKGQIIIVDPCGRVTFEIIMPWSRLQMPYVKATILSTHHDDPCGRCDISHTPEEVYKIRKDPIFPPVQQEPKKDDETIDVASDGTVPFNMVFHIPHRHYGNLNKRYENYELKSGDPTYHEHIQYDEGDWSSEMAENYDNPSQLPKYNTPPVYSGMTTTTELNIIKDETNEVNIPTDYDGNVETYDNDEISNEIRTRTKPTQHDVQQVLNHYKKLLRWIDLY